MDGCFKRSAGQQRDELLAAKARDDVGLRSGSTAPRKMAAAGWKLPPKPMRGRPRAVTKPRLLRPCAGEKTRAPWSKAPRRLASL